jgi:hypothetical protein
MNMTQFCAAALLAVATSAAAMAANDGRLTRSDLPVPARSTDPRARGWTPVSYGGEPGSMQLYIVDRASVRRAGTVVEVETLAINETPTPGGVDRVEERARFFCDRRTAVALRQRYFGGSRQLHLIEPKPVAESFPAGSAWRIVIDSVCDDAIDAQPTHDPRNYADAFFNA